MRQRRGEGEGESNVDVDMRSRGDGESCVRGSDPAIVSGAVRCSFKGPKAGSGGREGRTQWCPITSVCQLTGLQMGEDTSLRRAGVLCIEMCSVLR